MQDIGCTQSKLVLEAISVAHNMIVQQAVRGPPLRRDNPRSFQMTPLYTAHASAQGGREGIAASSDGKLEVRLSTPKELGGAGVEGTNPEQLFAAGYSAC